MDDIHSGRRVLLALIGTLYLYLSASSLWFQIESLSLEIPRSSETVGNLIRRRKPNGVVPTVLFVIDTTEKNYSSRVRDIRATYLLRVHEKRSLDLIFVGSTTTDGSPDMIASSCPIGYWEDSCKRADLITAAYDWLQEPGHALFDWIFFADDDAYLLPDNVQRMILSLGPGAVSRTAVWGIPACVHESCGGLCGGGGYFTNRDTLEKIQLGGDRVKYPSLRDETNKFDVECGRCGDLTIARVIEDHRNITLLHYPKGSYTWNFEDGDKGLVASLNASDPLPFLYHYPAKNRFPFVHEKVRELGSNKELPDD